MASTQNYDIPLPQLGEPADIRVLDQGTEMIDGIMHGNRTMVAPGWVSTETYNTGSRVVYLGEYYKCKADNITGAWDATKWDKTTVGEDIEGLGTGGASALADLDDVEITSPTKGQALLFDDSDDKWKNGTLPDPSVVKEVTGNPIELTDAASAPLVKCVTAITGSQDLHGYDKPWVGGAGKNKYPSIEPFSENGVTCVVNADGSFVLNGTATANINKHFFVDLPVGTYSLSLNNDKAIGTSSSNSVYAYAAEKTTSNWFCTAVAKEINAKDVNRTTSLGIQRVSFSIPSGTVIDNVVFKIQFEENSSSTSYVPYKNICPITAYTEGEIEVRGKNLVKQIIRGYVNSYNNTIQLDNASETVLIKVVKGVTYTLSASAHDRNVIGYAGVDTLVNGTPISNIHTLTSYTWTAEWSGWTAWYINSSASADVEATAQVEKGGTATSYEAPNFTTHTTTYPSAIYRGSEDVVNGTATTEWGMIASYAGETLPGEWISDRDEYIPGTTPTTGAQVAYELATPTTSSVTPTNLPIKSLSGYNHIESSTGSMTVEYIRNTYQPIVDLIQSSSHVYSTAEQIVGKWIDGKDIYEETFELQSEVTLTANQWNSITGVSLSGVETPISAEIRGSRGTSVANVDFMDSPVSVWGTSGTEKVKSITFRYTKSTSNRSLSAHVTSQKAQIEPLEEKGEEVPAEEEKAVETPVEEPETEEKSDER